MIYHYSIVPLNSYIYIFIYLYIYILCYVYIYTFAFNSFYSQVSIASFSLKIRKNHVFTYQVWKRLLHDFIIILHAHTHAIFWNILNTKIISTAINFSYEQYDWWKLLFFSSIIVLFYIIDLSIDYTHIV